jgi:pyruvate/2-oxoglutarate dehydrogenase complex dihydrolipoamide dehydrogenase (E3) component
MRLLVVGAGPAGVSAALHARELGAAVTLVEARQVGGTSVNEGPAPVRTLARAARLVRDARSWDTFGLRGEAPEVDVAAVLANAERVARYAHEHKRMADVLRGQGIDLIDEAGPARFSDAHTVRLEDGRTANGDAVVIAVGGHAGRLPVPGADLALTYGDVRTLERLPASVAVVGGADTGCQLASIFADFGAAVTLIEAAPRLLPRADEDISSGLADAFRRRGMSLLLDTQVRRLERTPAGIAVHTDGVLDVEAVFFAVGWPSNADTLDVENAGLALDRGYLPVGDDLRTAVPHIFAAGDVNGISMLVPSAMHEGRLAPTTRCSAPAAASPTTSCRPAASPIPSTAASG